MTKQTHSKGIICGMLAAISYAANPLFAVPMLAEGVHVNSILFYRYFLGALLYGALLLCVRRRRLSVSLRELPGLTILALMFSYSSICLFAAFQYIDMGISCTILFIYPSMVAVISFLFFGEKPSKSVLLAILLSTCGVALLSKGSGEINTQGVLLSLCSALLYALYIVGVRQMKSIRRVKSDKLNFYVMLLGLLVYICNLRFCADLQLLHTPFLWGCAILLAIIPTIISLESLTISIKLIGSTKAAIIGAMEPLCAILIGVTLFHEKLTWSIIVGFILIVTGVILTVTRRKNA